jgi:hypothetical protein
MEEEKLSKQEERREREREVRERERGLLFSLEMYSATHSAHAFSMK